MKIFSRAVLALLFCPAATSSIRGSASSLTEAQTLEEENSTLDLNNGFRRLDYYFYGCQGKFQAILRDPSAVDPEDCINNVCGTVNFACPDNWKDSRLTEVNYSITGLTPGLHALHVHEFPVGQVGGSTCASTGGHWNPEGQNHGGNLDAQRHIGDLGNILADGTGLAEGTLLARVPLKGSLAIDGRSVVVHAGTDDLGLGGDAGSRAVGNAGARPGCGTITSM